ncbi:hypothetical protein ACFWUZ_30870 [Streptomyces sp. NPDC058646]|uniref:hypothetical protein n=1 Tax=Streptomyces sp. NPDC058646 TaxID=3346574 RepID=UPI003656E212
MSAPAGAHREPRPSAVSMRTLLAAGLAATAVSTPPARHEAPPGNGTGGTGGVAAAVRAGAAAEQGVPESEAA